MKASYTLLSLLLSGSCYAQAQQGPAIEWQKCYGGTNEERGRDIKITPDGGYVMIGTTLSQDGDVGINNGTSTTNAIWVVKTDVAGNITWKKTYGSTQNDNGNSILPTPDGGYIFTGGIGAADGDATSTHGNEDLWVVKTDAAGNIQWQKAYGGSGGETGYTIIADGTDGYMVLGTTYSTNGDITSNHGDVDIWILHLDKNGNIAWQKTYGGSVGDGANDMKATADGGFIIAGNTFSSDGDLSSNNGIMDNWVIKINAQGKIQWQKSFGCDDNDFSNGIYPTKDGGCLLVGCTYDKKMDRFHGSGDVLVAKLDNIGNVSWQKAYGGSKAENVNNGGGDAGYDITEDANGNYVVLASTGSSDGDITMLHKDAFYPSDAWLFCIDPTGNLLWQKTYGGTGNDGRVRHLLPTKDGGFIATGSTSSADGDVTGLHKLNDGFADMWVFKTVAAPVAVKNMQTAAAGIKVYPTYASEIVHLELPTGYEHAEIRMMDIAGKIIPVNISGSVLDKTVDLNSLAAGMYALQVVANGRTNTYRIVH